MTMDMKADMNHEFDAKNLLDFQKVQVEFAKNLRNPELNQSPKGIEARRMKIYQELFYNNVENFCSNSFPILRSLMTEEQWHSWVRNFFTEHRATSPYFIDISKEFLNYLEEQDERFSREFVFGIELAHWEWMEIEATSNTQDILTIPHERNGDLMNEKVVVSPVAWPLVYEFDVHHISQNYQPEEAPQSPTFLIISRNRHHEVDFMEANPLTYRLLQIFQVHQDNGKQVSGVQALEQLIDETQFPQPEQLLAGGLQILQTLLEKDIILGTNG